MSPQSLLLTSLPSPSLLDVVDCYWLCLDNRDPIHVVLPDGTVDVVIQIDNQSAQSWVYGTTTTRADLPLAQDCHYLGIRFRPGQSRHFMTASARELTDTHESTQGLLKFSLEEIPEHLARGTITHHLDRILTDHLATGFTNYPSLDQVIQLIEAKRGCLRIDEAVDSFGQSRRQFERVFLETVGVSAKKFATIIRLQHATQLISSPSRLPLSLVAAELGYTDQSHMAHDFKRLIGLSPTEFSQDLGVFLQDPHLSSFAH